MMGEMDKVNQRIECRIGGGFFENGDWHEQRGRALKEGDFAHTILL